MIKAEGKSPKQNEFIKTSTHKLKRKSFKPSAFSFKLKKR